MAKTMTIRRQIAKIHKWTGLVIALFLAIQCVTGLLLVYRRELHAFLSSRGQDEIQFSKVVPLDWIVRTVSAAYPEHAISRVVYPVVEGQPFVVFLNVGEDASMQKIVEVGAVDGHVEMLSSNVAAIFDVLFRLHHVLLMESGIGRYWVGVTGFVLFIMLMSGAYIWWPGIARLRRSLAISKYRNPVTFFWQLHRTIGVSGLILVLVSACSGVLLAFGPELRSGFIADQPAPVSVADFEPYCDSSVLGAQIESAQARFPDMSIRDVRFNTASNSIERVLFFNRTSLGVGPPHQAWLHACDTEISKIVSGNKQLSADGVLSWSYPIHTGIALGHPGRLATVLAGLTLLGSLTTGVLLWTSRNRLKRAKRKAT